MKKGEVNRRFFGVRVREHDAIFCMENVCVEDAGNTLRPVQRAL